MCSDDSNNMTGALEAGFGKGRMMKNGKDKANAVSNGVGNGVIDRAAIATNNNKKNTDVEIDIVDFKPRISLYSAISFGVGCMIGAGIFISPTGALRNSGSVGMSLMLWTISGLISLIMGLVYCELSQIVPESGGDLAYINEGLGKIPAFLVVWANLIWSQTAQTAALALLCADYFLVFLFGSCTPPEYMRRTLAIVQIITLAITNMISIKVGIYVQAVSSVIKTIALFVIIVGGFVYLFNGHTKNLENAFEGSVPDISSYALALYTCMYAYQGYIRISEVTEEVHDAKKNVPRAIMISVLLVVVINILTNISYFVLIPKSEFLQSNAVAYEWALRGMTSFAGLIPLCVMCSVYGANNGGSFAVARVMFAAAKTDLFPEMFSYLHVHQSLPIVGIILHHTISLLLLLAEDIEKLINFLSFMTITMMFFSCISLLNLKYKMRGEKLNNTRFTTHVSLPIAGLISTGFLLVTPFVSNPPTELLYGVTFVLGGLLLYIPFIHFGIKLPGMDLLTTYSQLLLQVSATQTTRKVK